MLMIPDQNTAVVEVSKKMIAKPPIHISWHIWQNQHRLRPMQSQKCRLASTRIRSLADFGAKRHQCSARTMAPPGIGNISGEAEPKADRP